MIAVLSPAKSLNTDPAPAHLRELTAAHARRHAFEADTEALLKVARKLRPEAIGELMGISDKLAALNHARFQELTLPLEPGVGDALPAALLFDGDVYKGLDARTLPAADLLWANDHVNILSGLYGLLRPLDLAAPYRLEMGTSLKTSRGTSLYAFWGTRLAKTLDARLEGHDEVAVVGLASQEYDKAIDRKALKARWVDVSFKELKDGRGRVISFFAKRARGLMARFMALERVDRVDGLKDFALDGYRFDPELSTSQTLTFTRPQPPPVA